MNETLTYILIGASAAVFGVSVWQTSLPRRDMMRARVVPWRFLVFLSFVPLLYGVVHLVNLAGFTTGNGR